MRVSVLGGAMGVLLAAGAARGAPLSASFAVTRLPEADGCPDADALDASVARILGAPKPDPTATPAVQAEVEFAHGTTGYRATLRLRGAKEGERTLTDTGPTCAALGRAVGITLALLLDADGDGERNDAPAPRPASTLAAPALPPPLARPAATSGFVSLTAGPALGLVGAPSVAAGLELELRAGRRARLLVGGTYVAPRATTLDAGSVEVSLLAGRLGACGLLNDPASALHVALCGLASAGQLRGTGSGFDSAQTATLSWLSAGGGVRAQTVAGKRWLLAAGLALEAPLRKYTFSVAKVGTPYRSAAMAGMLQLGVGVEIW